MYSVYCKGYKLSDSLRINNMSTEGNGRCTSDIEGFPIDREIFEYLTATPLGILAFPHEMELEIYQEYKHNGFLKRTRAECKLTNVELMVRPKIYGDNQLYLCGKLTGDLSFVFLGGN